MALDAFGNHAQRANVNGGSAILFGNSQSAKTSVEIRLLELRHGNMLALARTNILLIELRVLLKEIINAIEQQRLLIGNIKIHEGPLHSLPLFPLYTD